MDKMLFRDGFWETIRGVGIIGLVFCVLAWLSDQKTRRQGLWLLAILLISGLIGGLLKGFGVRIIMGG